MGIVTGSERQPIEPPCSFMRETGGACHGAAINNEMMEQCKACEIRIVTKNKGCYNCRYKVAEPTTSSSLTCVFCRDVGEITGILHDKWEAKQ